MRTPEKKDMKTPKKSVQKTKVVRKRVKDIGPRPIEDWITNDKQRELVEQFIISAKQYDESMAELDKTEGSEAGWAVVNDIENGPSGKSHSNKAIKAGESVIANEKILIKLQKAGVPFGIAFELINSVCGKRAPGLIPYSQYKNFG